MSQIERRSSQFIIEPVSTEAQHAQIQSVREQVFEKELGIQLPRLVFGSDFKMRHMICLTKRARQPVGALTVQDTTGEHALHASFGLHFPHDKRVARYTQLAILKPYRGLNLNMELLLAANSCVTAPDQYDYTWLVIPARNNAVSFCRILGYKAGPELVDGEMGPSWALVKNERTQYAGGHESQCFAGYSWSSTAAASQNVGSYMPRCLVPEVGFASTLQPNEWHAQ